MAELPDSRDYEKKRGAGSGAPRFSSSDYQAATRVAPPQRAEQRQRQQQTTSFIPWLVAGIIILVLLKVLL